MKNNKDTKYTEEEIKEATKYAKRDMIMEYGPYIIIILFIILIRTFIATPVRVNGSSMFPTLHDKDTMILYKLTKKFKGINRFDIVVVESNGKYIIKRVIGLPGESVMYSDNKLYINGKVIEDNYSKSETENFENVILKDDEYFVMGDNREVSKDSRVIGPINVKNIKGKTNLVIFPFNKLGIVE